MMRRESVRGLISPHPSPLDLEETARTARNRIPDHLFPLANADTTIEWRRMGR
jgi:hypothetical protein